MTTPDNKPAEIPTPRESALRDSLLTCDGIGKTGKAKALAQLIQSRCAKVERELHAATAQLANCTNAAAIEAHKQGAEIGLLRAHLAALEECNRGLREVMQLDQVWSLPSMLGKLCQAVRHLRDVHNCDGHGHEEFYHALAAGERMSVGLAAALAQTPASVSDDLAALREACESIAAISIDEREAAQRMKFHAEWALKQATIRAARTQEKHP